MAFYSMNNPLKAARARRSLLFISWSNRRGRFSLPGTLLLTVLLSVALTDGARAQVIDLATLDGTNGFRLDGIAIGTIYANPVSGAGDVNGDGFDDIIIGAGEANNNTGESYVVFGKMTGFAASFDLATLDGSNGFRLDGIDPQDQSGESVSGAGDVNGDGFDDIIIGADRAAPGGTGFAGESYVVFG
ncbi:MAG: FG-GAP repeat protein, partial [Bacteroidetes bacterium]|nr:FG-GAP repeat protein [Bacteroidota bacterium]